MARKSRNDDHGSSAKTSQSDSKVISQFSAADHPTERATDATGDHTPKEAPPPETLAADQQQPIHFPVVGIGASAGGLSALKALFSQMPSDSGVAFVLVPHLDPTHESLMVELLARKTAMPVCEAKDSMPIEPDHVYIIPPNKHLAVCEGKLQLSAPSKGHGSPTAIDFFFQSLAGELHEKAIGIILSGTSNHGSVGLKEIKLAGGMVMAQQPESAEYSQMPENAIATGLVDFVLRPDEMPAALMKYVRHPYVQGALSPATEDAAWEELNRILAVLRTRTKYDFRGYRKNMLQRRVLRRMGICHLEQLTDYLDFLRNTPEEVTALYKDLLIGVTEFFRDPEAFQVLQQRVIPELIGRGSLPAPAGSDDAGSAPPRPPVRIWIPACATGEEAYSIAMLFFEQYTAEKKSADIQIFATDIDERSLEVARLGIYPDSSLQAVSPERRQRFFSRIDGQRWQVSKQLREVITFAPQNLISDAPFSKLDLVSCRNLLIYLEPEVQAKVIRLFHFALSQGGYLLLGPSESIGRDVDLFAPLSKKWRVFQRTGVLRRDLLEIPIMAAPERRRLRMSSPEAMPTPTIGLKELLQRLVLENFAPASALVTRTYEIVSVLGPLVNYLEFPPGELTHDLLAMARPGLRTKIRAAIHKALQTTRTVTDPDARAKRDGRYIRCSVTVRPLTEPKDAAGLLLITFQDREPTGRIGIDDPGALTPDESESLLIQQLDHELKSTREDLQSTVEEYESSVEELKASSEEVMSMNEELQSANEELETSKEELQSLNEELTTVNNQLQEKVEELDRSNSDLSNLLASSEVATVFLDTELCIKRFTEPVAILLNLRPTDLGRPFSDISRNFNDDSLFEDCRTVLDKLIPLEKEVWVEASDAGVGPRELRAAGRVEGSKHTAEAIPDHNPQTSTGPRCYLRRILPYRTANHRIDGVVLTFTDISQRMEAESQARRLATVLCDSNDAVTVQDFDGRILAWNRGAEQMYGYSAAEALQMNVVSILPEQKRDEARDFVRQYSKSMPVQMFETQRLTKDGRILDVELTVTAYRDEQGRPIGVATTERDVTQRKRVALALRQLNDTLEQRVAEQTREVKLLAEAVSHLGEGVLITSDHLDWPGPRIVFVNEAMSRITGYPTHELLGQTPRILQGKETSREAIDRLKQDLSAGRSSTVEVVNYRKDGTPYDAELFITPLYDAAGSRTNFVSIHRDISNRKRAEQALKEQEWLARGILDSLTAQVAVLDREGRIVRVNPAWERYGQQHGATNFSRTGVGTNYFDVCQSAADSGDQLAAQALQGLRAVLERKSAEFCLEYSCHSGQEQRWFMLNIAPFPPSAPWGAVVSHIQITDRKQAETAARDREEQMRAILNTALDAIVTIDRHGVITTANPATERLFGYAQQELVGHNVRLLMPSPYREEHDGYIDRYLKTGEARIIGMGRELTGQRKDGSIFPMDLAVSQVNHLGLFTGIIRDISFRKELQNQILEIAAEEQRRIGQELHDGTGQELTGLSLVAGTLVTLLDEVPLTGRNGQASWQIEESEMRRIREAAKRLSEALMEANRHVQQLSHGIMPVEIEPEGLRSALQELALATDGPQGIRCRFECPAAIAVANNTAATHLYRIAQEAVNNALRHGRADEIVISLIEEHGQIVMDISDNGIGFDPATKTRLYGSGESKGFGLDIMHYRAGMIGGILRISRRTEGGMSVRCILSPSPVRGNHGD